MDCNTVKLTDFGRSRNLIVIFESSLISKASYYKGDAGDLRFMAPEVLSKQRFSRRSDVYSFGLTLWCALTAEEPFSDVTTFVLPGKVLNGDRPLLPQLPGMAALESLIERCWAPVRLLILTFLRMSKVAQFSASLCLHWRSIEIGPWMHPRRQKLVKRFKYWPIGLLRVTLAAPTKLRPVPTLLVPWKN